MDRTDEKPENEKQILFHKALIPGESFTMTINGGFIRILSTNFVIVLSCIEILRKYLHRAYKMKKRACKKIE